MLKTCKICGRKYVCPNNEYLTDAYLDGLCSECAEKFIKISDNTNQ
jgi:hypothetical protein